MVDYVTRTELLRLSQQNLTESLESINRAKARRPDSAVFLSHSSSDDDLMPAVVRILENHSAEVYLDKKDSSLSTMAPRDIGTALRDRIRVSKKFVLFASENIKLSTWVPWELGLADSSKSSRNVAIFPAVEKQGEFSWAEQEYLGVYDRLVWGSFKGQTEAKWMVWNQDANTAVGLREWLQR